MKQVLGQDRVEAVFVEWQSGNVALHGDNTILQARSLDRFLRQREHGPGAIYGRDSNGGMGAGKPHRHVGRAATYVQNIAQILGKVSQQMIHEPLVGRGKIRLRVGKSLFRVFHDFGFEYSFHGFQDINCVGPQRKRSFRET